MVIELLYADDIAPISKTMKNLIERFWNWKDALQSNGLKVNIEKISDGKWVGRSIIQEQDRFV